MNASPIGIGLLLIGTLGAALFPAYPGFSLVAGFLVSLFLTDTLRAFAQRVARPLLGWAIVGLGLTVTLPKIFQLSVDYLLITMVTIFVVIALGIVLGRLLKMNQVIAALVAAGTAICGASAIVAVSGAIKAKAEETGMALSVVLILNAVALVLFPHIGELLSLAPTTFAAWAGLGIHDTSSVVAATLAYAPAEVAYATTVKLARAVWIVPLVILFGRVLPGNSSAEGGSTSVRLPWFLWGYLVAALVASFVSLPVSTSDLTAVARILFSVGLFLTGSAVNARALIHLGPRPLALGVVLWCASAGLSLYWLVSS